MSTDQGASAKADRAATPSEPSQSSVVSGIAGIPCAFTPGPWQWVGDNEIEQAEHPFTSVAEIVHLRRDPDTQIANSRLIAAAPKMYRACILAREALAHEPFFDSDPELQDVLAAVNDALAQVSA